VTHAETEVAIVLTAAIIVSTGSTAIADASERRKQYLAAARFYTQFAPVFFLENSGYDLLNDTDFRAIAGVRLRPIAAQEGEERGKGYREFHAIDLWYEAEAEKPRRILKITGRYIFTNIQDLLAECREAPEDLLLFDRHHHDRFAVTGIFSVSWRNYARYLQGLYREVNDPDGIWIEHMVYTALDMRKAPCRFFRHEPDVRGISGSSGQAMRASRLKYTLKWLLRAANRLVDNRYLYLRGQTLISLKRLVR
jgi:hypothetical protein